MIFGFVKKILFFLKFVFSFLGNLNKQKDFLHFWAKNNLLLYTQRVICPFDPPKCFLEAYSTSYPQNTPSVTTLTFVPNVPNRVHEMCTRSGTIS